MKNEVAIYKIEKSEYPSPEEYFRPHKAYPEMEGLPVSSCSKRPNYVYDGVRNTLLMLGYDKENIGTKNWNPLRGLISPGQSVVLKPNLVMHRNQNEAGKGRECLYTHPSVVAAVLDYVILAMTDEAGIFSGSIVVGDAPLQSCDFERLVRESGYARLICYYRKKGYAVQLKDFRNVRVAGDGWVYKKQGKDRQNGIVVSLGNRSNFSRLSPERMRRLRITNYDPGILKKHHSRTVHEYRIADEILKADAVINISKPKTHRKAGVTIAVKNLVGINANKEYLPHHTAGSWKSGKGDEYLHTNIFFSLAGFFLDWKNTAAQQEHYMLARMIHFFAGFCNVTGRKFAKEPYREGSWYGNDTIWRTIYDLNNIILFADRQGNIRDSIQRNVLHIADMVIAGEGDGPLAPSAKECGVIAAGENAALFDECICALMGIDGQSIPSIRHLRDKGRLFFPAGQAEVASNRQEWNTGEGQIKPVDSFQFEPNPGWMR